MKFGLVVLQGLLIKSTQLAVWESKMMASKLACFFKPAGVDVADCYSLRLSAEDRRSKVSPSQSCQNDGYVNLARNIPLFPSLHSLPINLGPATTDKHGSIEKTFRDKTRHATLKFACFFSTTQGTEKSSTPAATWDETKTLQSSQRETNRGELRGTKTMTVNKRRNECGLNSSTSLWSKPPGRHASSQVTVQQQVSLCRPKTGSATITSAISMHDKATSA